MKPDETAGIPAWDRIEGVPDPLENMELVGHAGAMSQLAEAFAGKRMHHAWLVTGPRGIGKATLAARFAGHVLRHGDNAPPEYLAPEPGDPVERQVAHGAHPNLLVLRRAWNERDKKWRTELTVDEMRRTLTFFGTSTGANGWRVAIVDTANDMNRSAANALLKVLEEPPPRTLFFVLAHSWQNMLATIRSRCRTLTMRPLDSAEIERVLQNFGLLEGVSAEDRQKVAELAAGSVRRAILVLRADGLSLHKKFIGLASDPRGPDWQAIHALAGEISPVARENRYRLLLDFAQDHITRQVRDASNPDGAPPDISTLAGWAEVWEKVRRSADRTDTYNLDRKQVVLNLFSAIYGI